jgi:hypothetical protein
LEGKVYVSAIDGRPSRSMSLTVRRYRKKVTVDQSRPYTITGAPRVIKGKVIIGNGGAELGGTRLCHRLRCQDRRAGLALFTAQPGEKAGQRRLRQDLRREG